MEIRRYSAILNRHKWVVLLTTLVTLIVVAVGVHNMAPVYSASALVRISEIRTTPVGYSDLNYVQRLQNTYVQLAQSRAYLQQTIRALDLSLRPEDLAGMVKVETLQNTELIRITATGPSPVEAAGISNVIATLLLQQKPSSYDVSVVEGAPIPTEPIGPRLQLYMALGFLVGLLGGIGLAFLLENLDTSIRSAGDLEGMVSLPLLAWIPRFGRRWAGNSGPRLDGTEGSTVGEAFRVLSTNTLSSAERFRGRSRVRSLLVTSAEPRAGKSTVAINLAAAVARKGRRVVIVDGDLRGPSLHRVLGLERGLGLLEVIADPDRLSEALQTTEIPGVKLLPSGLLGSSELLSSPSMRVVMQRLSGEADLVLLDSAPVLSSADTAVLASMVDGVLLVVARDQTTGRSLSLALRQLEHVGARMLGLVFNKARGDGDGFLYYSHEGDARKGANESLAELPVRPS